MAELARVQKAYTKMASVKMVEEAANQAGMTMAGSMKSMIQSQPDLSSYADVAQGFTAWRGPETVHVGLPEDHPLLSRATDMEEQFPLMEVMLDIERQTGETQRAFYDALATLTGLREEPR